MLGLGVKLEKKAEENKHFQENLKELSGRMAWSLWFRRYDHSPPDLNSESLQRLDVVVADDQWTFIVLSKVSK